MSISREKNAVSFHLLTVDAMHPSALVKHRYRSTDSGNPLNAGFNVIKGTSRLHLCGKFMSGWLEAPCRCQVLQPPHWNTRRSPTPFLSFRISGETPVIPLTEETRTQGVCHTTQEFHINPSNSERSSPDDAQEKWRPGMWTGPGFPAAIPERYGKATEREIERKAGVSTVAP